MKFIYLLMAAFVLSACQPIAATSASPKHTNASSKIGPSYTRTSATSTAVASPAPMSKVIAVPDADNELIQSELKYCLNLENDVLNIFEKLSRKDGLISEEYDKLERVVLRQAQIESRIKTDDVLRQTYNDLTSQRIVQVNRVLSLFRDRNAIYTRMHFLNEDRNTLCKGKKFTHSNLVQACKDSNVTNTFRCNSIF